MCCPEKQFESNPHILDCWHAIPLTNLQYKLACSVKNRICNIHCPELGVQRPGDVGKLEKLFDGSECGHGRVSRVVSHIIDNVFAFKKLVRHQLKVIVLEAR